MIVKIWPIKADYGAQKGKVGGVEGLKNAVDYVSDTEKVTAQIEDTKDFMPYQMTDILDNSFVNTEADFSRVVNYMGNQDKTEAKYVSAYLCSEDDPTRDFRAMAELLAIKSNLKVDPNSGAVAFHLVQSFPGNLSIPDAEVHECGMDLVRRIKKHQAFICSHVHPVVDEDGKIHGKFKHNHILINAYIHPDFYDGGQGKYNDCIETYRQLQIWNDEIAIEHGLPIIRDPDMDRVYTWKESAEKNKGTSWKERMRMDIETYRRVARNWDDFLAILCEEGYQVEGKKHLTYLSPDGKRARAEKLGARYTKESLELYWAIRDNAKAVLKNDLKANQEPVLSDFVYNYEGVLSVKIPLGPQFLENRQFAYMPLNGEVRADEKALRTYMEMDKLYDICDASQRPVIAASGIEILRSIEDLRDEGRMAYRAQKRMREEEIRKEREKREAELEEQKQAQCYSNRNFRSSRTGAIYRAELYDEDGRRRSSLELMFVLALVILDKESYLWVPRGEIPQDQENEVFFATTNWKLQHIIDSIELARQEELDTPAQLGKRLDAVGADYSRAKKGYNNTLRAAERMEPLANAVAEYKRTKPLVEGIQAMPEGAEKAEMLEKYHGLMEEYKAAKHVMYVSGLDTEVDVAEFEARHRRIEQDVVELEARMNEHGEHYRRLKKLSYSLQLAQDPKFVYGMAYPQNRVQNKEVREEEEVVPTLWHKLDEARAKTEDRDEANDTKRKDTSQEDHYKGD